MPQNLRPKQSSPYAWGSGTQSFEFAWLDWVWEAYGVREVDELPWGYGAH